MSNERNASGPRIASVISPGLLAVLEELRPREPIFHHPEFGTKRRDYEAMTDTEFWEVRASGRRYSREFVLDKYLITYTLHQGNRGTRRATLWRRTAAGWTVLYHQGTMVEPDKQAREK